jgi:hypothetical protein
VDGFDAEDVYECVSERMSFIFETSLNVLRNDMQKVVKVLRSIVLAIGCEFTRLLSLSLDPCPYSLT